jgi:hypothetical protein
MTNARHRFTPAKGRRVPTVAALALAIVGALLITLAACSSRSGPPQPSAAAAGTIGGTSDGSSANAPATAASASAAPSTSPVATPGSSKSSASVGKSSPAPSTSKVISSSPAKTGVGPAGPTTKIAPPSFANAAKGPVMLPSQPVSLSVPAIGVKSDLVTLGLNPDGTVQVPSLDDPSSKAGWYKNSPTPGSVGPSIILGHIDSKKYGPGVFYDLGNLKPGDEIDVNRQDGSVAVFKVDGVRTYPKSAFPTSLVYGNLDHAGLRLITCGGTFDPSISSYESNIVAFASLVSTR